MAQAIPTIACDDLIITDSLLLPQAQRLAEYRNQNSLDEVEHACVLTMDDLAMAHPDAAKPSIRILRAIRFYQKSSTDSIRFLTLFGDASFTPGSPYDHVPTLGYWQNLSGKREDVSFDEAYAIFPDCDSCLGVIGDTLVKVSQFSLMPGVGGEASSVWKSASPPLFSVGRIPASTLEQAKAYVDKVIAYEALDEKNPNNQTIGIVADDDRQGSNPEPISIMPGLQNEFWDSLAAKPFVRRVASVEYDLSPDSTLPKATDSLIQMWNSELQFLYFFGHGSPLQWSDEKLFDLARDSSRLLPKVHQPILIPAACSTTPFAIDSQVSMAEALIFRNGGAIAWVGGSGESFPGPNNRFLVSWLIHPPLGHIALGSLLNLGWNKADNYKDSHLYPWVLIGDPALMVHFPDQSLKFDPTSTRIEISFPLGMPPYDSVYFEIVKRDTVQPTQIPRTQPAQTSNWFYERETLVYSEKRALQSGEETFRIPLADTLNPVNYSVKVLVWNTSTSSFGSFPLSQFPAGSYVVRQADRRHKGHFHTQLFAPGGWLNTSGVGSGEKWIRIDGKVALPGFPLTR